MDPLIDKLSANAYPGRGIACVRTAREGVSVVYFVTGRSEASKRRTMRGEEGMGLLVVPSREAAADDALRHYAAAVAAGEWLVVGNGAQVRMVADRLTAGQAPTVALDGLEHEPDDPIFTDRITAVVSRPRGDLIVLGAARRGDGSSGSSTILTWTVRDLEKGEGVLLTTYASDGHTIGRGSFHEVTSPVLDQNDLLDEVWSALRPDYRVAAAVIDTANEPEGALIRNAESAKDEVIA